MRRTSEVEKVSFKEMQSSDMISHVILESLIALSHAKVNEVISKSLLESDNERCLEVEFKVNGTEVQFSRFCKVLGDQWDKRVMEAAGEIVRDKISDLTNKMDNLSEEISQVLLNLVGEKLGADMTKED